ncbi:MAG: phosphoribosylanthranilate isomerase [Betaproteobacteria bacterium]|nr:phosphoribosylanthranilate isomerase [Betaproteobacteria bacterium]
MRTRIKVCGLTREADVEAAVQAGVDALGFVFYELSPRSVSVQQAQRLVRRVPAWVAIVGLFVNAPRSMVMSVADEVGLSHLQLHGDESPEDCRGLGRPVIKAIRLAAKGEKAAGVSEPGLADWVAAYSDCHAVLFDADSAGFGGSGQAFDWARLTGAFTKAPRHEASWVLSGGLESGSVGKAIAQLAPPCVDVSSGVEALENGKQLKGLKDAIRIREFVAAVQAADASRNSKINT